MRSKGSRFTLGGVGVELCSPDVAFTSTTVRNRDVSKVVLCGRRDTFATSSEDALHFSWQAQHFGHPMSFCVAGAALRRVEM